MATTDNRATGLPPVVWWHRRWRVIGLAAMAGIVFSNGFPRSVIAVLLALAGAGALITAAVTALRGTAGRYGTSALGWLAAGGMLLLAANPWAAGGWRALLALPAGVLVTGLAWRLSRPARPEPPAPMVMTIAGMDVRTLSHELRTPLTVVVGNLEVMLDDAAGPLNPSQRRLLEAADRSALRLQARVADLTGTTREPAGRARPMPPQAE